jgi:hypothetical protein
MKSFVAAASTALIISFVSHRQQIAKTESVTRRLFADAELNRLLKYRAVENKCVEFSVLPTGIDARRQVGEECFVKQAPREGRIENTRIDANRNRAEGSAR